MSNARNNVEKLNQIVSVTDYGAKGDGVTDDTAAIQAAIATGKNVYFPAGTYKIISALEPAAGTTLYGDGIDQTTILAADGITAIRIKVSFVTLSNLNIRCDRAVSGAWLSTAAKGIYAKIGPDNVASDPTAYIQGLRLENLRVQRFYESIEVNGAYFVDVDDVQTIQDNFGFIFNRNTSGSFGFAGTTLTMKKAYARGTNNQYTANVGSIGLQVVNYTNVSAVGCASERYEQSAYFRTVQSGNVDDFYCEFAKYGLEFHTITGAVYCRSVYYNSVGQQYAVGGFTLKVLFGSLIYSPGRFVVTDNSAEISTSGKLLALGQSVTTLTGSSATEYTELAPASSIVDTLTANARVRIGSKTNRAAVSVAGVASVNKTVTAKLSVNAAQSDWRHLIVRLITVSGRTDLAADVTYQEKVLTFSYTASTNTISSIGDINVSLPGNANVTLNTQAIASGEITITLTALAKSSGPWVTEMIVETTTTTASSSLTLTST